MLELFIYNLRIDTLLCVNSGFARMIGLLLEYSPRGCTAVTCHSPTTPSRSLNLIPHMSSLPRTLLSLRTDNAPRFLKKVFGPLVMVASMIGYRWALRDARVCV